MKTIKQAKAFRLEFEGKTRREIAALTGIKENTLNIYLAKKGRWHKEYNGWFKGEIDKLRLQYQHQAALMALEAVRALSKCMQCDNPKVVLATAKHVLDTTGFKAYSAAQNTQNIVGRYKRPF